jgi:putative ATP-dependent DNA ligase
VFTPSSYIYGIRLRAVASRFGDFFADQPEELPGAELISPETAYSTHDYDNFDSLAIRVFGVRDRELGTPLSVAERDDQRSTYGDP